MLCLVLLTKEVGGSQKTLISSQQEKTQWLCVGFLNYWNSFEERFPGERKQKDQYGTHRTSHFSRQGDLLEHIWSAF